MTLPLRSCAVAALVLSAATFAQQPFSCGTDLMRQRAIQADPSILQKEAHLEAYIQNWIQEHRGQRDEDTTVLTIPVVFHVIHMDGPENISNEQIFDEMEVLNRDYRKLNADVNTVCCGFQSIAADIRLQFRLATVDPEGNCTNGIDRIRSVETFQGDNGSKLNAWPRERYLNVWTMARMQNGVAGYSQYPSAVEGANAPADGVIILSDYIGRIGTGAEFKSRALTHEIGHFLNLQHCWGDNNGAGGAPPGHMSPTCGDDAVEDTPWTRGWNICPSANQSKNCNDTIFENFENYMEYSYCSKMFTEGQRERMRAALSGATADRDSLFTLNTLRVTGVADGFQRTCAPVADFTVFNDAVGALNNDSTPQGTRFYCLGDEVNFFDNSRQGTVTSWQWTFQDGDPATSGDRNPVVTFTTPGWKTVSLTVSNDQGSSSVTKQYVVRIADPFPQISGVLQEGFEAPCNHCQDYIADNYEANATLWQQVSGVGHNSNSCMRINGYNTYGFNDYFIDDGGSDIDALTTPTMDLTWLHNGQLTFWYAYATRTTDLTDETEVLQIWSSTNCGRQWTLRKQIAGTDLLTNGASNSFYVPTDANEWRQATVDLPTSVSHDQVRFKFIYVSSAASNNLYIDDLNISGTVGLDEVPAQPTGLVLAPNPSTGDLSINYSLPGSGRGTLSIVDASGRVLWSQATRNMAQDRVHVDLHALGLSAGVYLVRLDHELGQRIERLVVN